MTQAFQRRASIRSVLRVNIAVSLASRTIARAPSVFRLRTKAAAYRSAWQLYLPEIWAHDLERRKKARIPDDIIFQTKPQIALGQIHAVVATKAPVGVILADAGTAQMVGSGKA
ncbi:transposase [Mesorhizobium sp. C280B]|uniref:transposase n=1 Tax=Mesorhizobium sp. C280B TaxID=2956828 RepID=UPI0003CF3A0F|nr:hypothetical protein X772_32225 [Mesorhizobium sp. LSJC280B00]